MEVPSNDGTGHTPTRDTSNRVESLSEQLGSSESVLNEKKELVENGNEKGKSDSAKEANCPEETISCGVSEKNCENRITPRNGQEKRSNSPWKDWTMCDSPEVEELQAFSDSYKISESDSNSESEKEDNLESPKEKKDEDVSPTSAAIPQQNHSKSEVSEGESNSTSPALNAEEAVINEVSNDTSLLSPLNHQKDESKPLTESTCSDLQEKTPCNQEAIGDHSKVSRSPSEEFTFEDRPESNPTGASDTFCEMESPVNLAERELAEGNSVVVEVSSSPEHEKSQDSLKTSLSATPEKTSDDKIENKERNEPIPTESAAETRQKVLESSEILKCTYLGTSVTELFTDVNKEYFVFGASPNSSESKTIESFTENASSASSAPLRLLEPAPGDTIAEETSKSSSDTQPKDSEGDADHVKEPLPDSAATPSLNNPSEEVVQFSLAASEEIAEEYVNISMTALSEDTVEHGHHMLFESRMKISASSRLDRLEEALHEHEHDRSETKATHPREYPSKCAASTRFSDEPVETPKKRVKRTNSETRDLSDDHQKIQSSRYFISVSSPEKPSPGALFTEDRNEDDSSDIPRDKKRKGLGTETSGSCSSEASAESQGEHLKNIEVKEGVLTEAQPAQSQDYPTDEYSARASSLNSSVGTPFEQLESTDTTEGYTKSDKKTEKCIDTGAVESLEGTPAYIVGNSSTLKDDSSKPQTLLPTEHPEAKPFSAVASVELPENEAKPSEEETSSQPPMQQGRQTETSEIYDSPTKQKPYTSVDAEEKTDRNECCKEDARNGDPSGICPIAEDSNSPKNRKSKAPQENDLTNTVSGPLEHETDWADGSGPSSKKSEDKEQHNMNGVPEAACDSSLPSSPKNRKSEALKQNETLTNATSQLVEQGTDQTDGNELSPKKSEETEQPTAEKRSRSADGLISSQQEQPMKQEAAPSTASAPAVARPRENSDTANTMEHKTDRADENDVSPKKSGKTEQHKANGVPEAVCDSSLPSSPKNRKSETPQENRDLTNTVSESVEHETDRADGNDISLKKSGEKEQHNMNGVPEGACDSSLPSSPKNRNSEVLKQNETLTNAISQLVEQGTDQTDGNELSPKKSEETEQPTAEKRSRSADGLISSQQEQPMKQEAAPFTASAPAVARPRENSDTANTAASSQTVPSRRRRRVGNPPLKFPLPTGQEQFEKKKSSEECPVSNSGAVFTHTPCLGSETLENASERPVENVELPPSYADSAKRDISKSLQRKLTVCPKEKAPVRELPPRNDTEETKAHEENEGAGNHSLTGLSDHNQQELMTPERNLSHSQEQSSCSHSVISRTSNGHISRFGENHNETDGTNSWNDNPEFILNDPETRQVYEKAFFDFTGFEVGAVLPTEYEYWATGDDFVVAIENHYGIEDGLLRLDRGEKVFILSFTSNGWACCRNKKGDIGFVPGAVIPGVYAFSLRQNKTTLRPVYKMKEDFTWKAIYFPENEPVTVIADLGDDWALVRPVCNPNRRGFVPISNLVPHTL